MESVICDLCGENRTQILWSVPDRFTPSQIFNIVQCENCNLVYVNPRPTREEIVRYYPEDYPHYIPVRGLQRLAKSILLDQEIKQLKKFLPMRSKILEIGTGCGEDLAYIKEKGMWNVAGTDLSAYAAQSAGKNFGLDIHVGELKTLQFQDNEFDFVRLKYVLSHVHSPKTLIHEISRILKPGGRVLTWIPNFNSLDRMIFGFYWKGQEAPHHLYEFSNLTISKYLEEAGFYVEKITHTVVPNTFIHSFKDLLKNLGMPKFLTKLFGLNAFSLLLFLPLSLFSALIKKSDRIVIQAIKK